MNLNFQKNRVISCFKSLSLSCKLVLVLSVCLGILMTLLVLFGKISFIDGLIFILLPVVLISIIAIFMVKLIFASLYERDYTGKLSPVYKRLLKNREKMGRDK